MKKLHYNNFYESAEYSSDDKVFYGKIIRINDLVLYEGENLAKLEGNFKEAVDDYLQ